MKRALLAAVWLLGPVMAGCAHWPQWERPKEHDDVVNAFMAG